MDKPKLTGKKCRCSGCGETFSNLSNFDAHRYGDQENRICGDPAIAGLTKKDGVWHKPMTEEQREKMAKIWRK